MTITGDIVITLMWVMVQCYRFIHYVVPRGILTWLADHAPLWPDTFAPRGFLEPTPCLPIHALGTDYRGVVERMGWRLMCKLVLLDWVRVVGKVVRVEGREGENDWHHSTFVIDNCYGNRFNHIPGGVEIEGAPGSPLPKVGDIVSCDGVWTVDLANGWLELQLGMWRLLKR